MDEIVKLIGIVASVFVLYKIVVDVVLARSSKHREEYKFSKEYVNDLNDESIHSFILEKGFLALTGRRYTVSEIKYLLSFSNPGQVIGYRSLSEKFIDFDEDNLMYTWKGMYKSNAIREILPLSFMGGYLFFALLAISPIYFSGIEVLKGYPIIVFCISLAVAAIICLISSEDFKSAKKLMLQKMPEPA